MKRRIVVEATTSKHWCASVYVWRKSFADGEEGWFVAFGPSLSDIAQFVSRNPERAYRKAVRWVKKREVEDMVEDFRAEIMPRFVVEL